VIVGSGLAGLLPAYYLSNYGHNKITVLERNDKHYQGTSYQNGNWLPVDYTSSWTNKPFYPWAFNALFRNENNVSKIYFFTAFESLRNLQIIAKFSACWFSKHPSPEEYAFITLHMYK